MMARKSWVLIYRLVKGSMQSLAERHEDVSWNYARRHKLCSNILNRSSDDDTQKNNKMKKMHKTKEETSSQAK